MRNRSGPPSLQQQQRQQRPVSLVAMRLHGSAAELRALLRRWSGFVLVVAMVLGPFFTTLIGWPALPLFWAVQQAPQGAGLALLAIYSHALPAALLCWALREQLLPARWLPAEASLPLSGRQRLVADLAVLALAQAPWLLLNLISMLAWRRDSPAWMQGLWLGVLAGFAASLLISSALGVLALHWQRRRPVVPARRAPRMAAPDASSASPQPLLAKRSPWFSLLWLPLWRGPARAVLWAWLLALLSPWLSLLLAWHWPQQASWALALFTLLVMGWTARLHSLAQRCFGPLRQASQLLPIADTAWAWRLAVLSLLPAFLAWLALAGLLMAGPWLLAPRATPLFMLLGLLAPTLAIAFDGGGAELRAARWLLCWAVWVAAASEVLM